jgi:hypothetical protein
MRRREVLLAALPIVGMLLLGAAPPAMANHKLGKLHWAAETAATTVALNLNDSGVSGWGKSSVRSDWDSSGQIAFVSSGGVDITATSDDFGNTGYLGAAFITYTPGSGHITSAEVQLNEFYDLTPDQQRSVYCQELGHTLGLNHLKSPKFDASTSCMNDRTFALSPNWHDFAQLDSIYSHADGFNSFATASRNAPGRATIVIPAP